MTRSPTRLVWLAWAGIGAFLVVALMRPIATLPGDETWLRRFDTLEIAPGRVFSQTFTMNRNGLTAVEFSIAPLGPPARDISVTLLDITVRGQPLVVYADAIKVAALGDRQSFRAEFPPIADSEFRTYELDVSGTDGRSGYALVAAKGDGYAQGTMYFNDRARWADLIFQTYVSPPVRSIWTTLWQRHASPGRASGKLILALLGLNWIAAGFLLRALLGVGAATLQSTSRPV